MHSLDQGQNPSVALGLYGDIWKLFNNHINAIFGWYFSHLKKQMGKGAFAYSMLNYFKLLETILPMDFPGKFEYG